MITTYRFTFFDPVNNLLLMIVDTKSLLKKFNTLI